MYYLKINTGAVKESDKIDFNRCIQKYIKDYTQKTRLKNYI